jgi:hypothetical protein
MEADCWNQFMESRSDIIACELPTLLEAADREELQKITRNVFRDAHCRISIKIERSLVNAAAAAPDYTFVAPPQPVACEVETSRGTWQVAFTFAPQITIKGGTAIAATPGMDHVTGVNSWLAWPVVAYVNASSSIQDIMLRVTNAYLQRRKTQASQP